GAGRRAALLLAGTMLGGLLLAGAPVEPALASETQQTAQATTYRFDVAPQPLPGALVAFSETTGIQFFFDSALARGLSSPGASGEMAPEEALRRLLAGTGLGYRFTNPTTVTLERTGAAQDGS